MGEEDGEEGAGRGRGREGEREGESFVFLVSRMKYPAPQLARNGRSSVPQSPHVLVLGADAADTVAPLAVPSKSFLCCYAYSMREF